MPRIACGSLAFPAQRGRDLYGSLSLILGIRHDHRQGKSGRVAPTRPGSGCGWPRVVDYAASTSDQTRSHFSGDDGASNW